MTGIEIVRTLWLWEIGVVGFAAVCVIIVIARLFCRATRVPPELEPAAKRLAAKFTDLQALEEDRRWRSDRRKHHQENLAEWDHQYRLALPSEPPKPLCTSTKHSHHDLYTWGGVLVAHICEDR